MTTGFSPLRPVLAAVLLGTLVLLGPLAAGAEGGPRDARESRPQTAPEESDAPRCVHGCLRWGKFCNVDPRGVYKCQRRCEKFGEICE